MTKLKPCPFCGGRADLTWGRINNGLYRYHGRCLNDACYAVGPSQSSVERTAVRAWNRRVKEPKSCR